MAVQWTDKKASPPEAWPQEQTANVLLPGTVGPDGEPLVATIRALPPMAVSVFSDLKDEAPDSPAMMEAYREMVKVALVVPRLCFNDIEWRDGQYVTRWDAIPFTAQMALVEAIGEFTKQGLEEVGRLAEEFRKRYSPRTDDGDAGGGRAPTGAAEAAPA